MGGRTDVSHGSGGYEVDLNADAGESFGPWKMGRDEELFPLVTSVNLACGFHAGDPATMLRSVRLAREQGVAVGAHPGHPDKVGFGRRNLSLSPSQAFADVLYQLGALDAILRSEGMRMHHVKPHGALYMQMLEDESLAGAVAEAVTAFAEDLPLVVLASSKMESALGERGVKMVSEAFPDRGYLANGRLAPRHMAGALVRDPDEAGRRAVKMVRGEPIETVDGGTLSLRAQTLCIHGDNPEAVEIAAQVRSALESAGVALRAF